MQKIKKEDILRRVIFQVTKAKKEIIMTMKHDDNSVSISEEYFNILNEKISEGMIIKRLFFGTTKSFDRFISKKVNGANYKCKLASSNNYKRMILIDGSKLFFKINDEFRYSKNKETIKKYLKYFSKEWCE